MDDIELMLLLFVLYRAAKADKDEVQEIELSHTNQE